MRLIAIVIAVVLTGNSLSVVAQNHIEQLPYGNMDQWILRKVTESAIIGKNNRELYAPGRPDTVCGKLTYDPGDSPWATSNVVAKVSGVTKASISVYPEKRGEGYCARLETAKEVCSALGIVNIKVLVGGSFFLGRSIEPVRGTSNPRSKIASGIPFRRKPTSLVFDYKVKLSGKNERIRLDGFSRQKTVEGKDMPMVCLFLQKRWEDASGALYAKRIGTVVAHFAQDTGWVEQACFPIRYGDITKEAGFYSYMDLLPEDDLRYAYNSKGENVPVKEVGWGAADEEPTHLILEFLSSHGGCYVGMPGTTFWVDNIGFVYSDTKK